MRGGASFGWAARRARRMSTMLATCLALPLGGCLLTDAPDPALTIPSHYSGAPNLRLAEARTPPLDWWRSFRSRELTGIIEDVRTSNLDIAQAVARVVQADAQARVTGAALLPQVQLNG